MSRSRTSEYSSAASQPEDAVKFKKVLWRKQPFPDNFVPDTFLAELRTNSNLRLVSFKELAFASLPISQHFLSVMLFVSLFVHLRLGSIDPELTLVVATGVVGFAWAVAKLVTTKQPDKKRKPTRSRRRGGNVLGLLILCLVLLAVSPVLRTLTESTTSDSIWALSAILFIVNLSLADYSSATIAQTSLAAPASLSETLSLNAAICASVVLASRLQSNIQVFTLLYLSISMFALFPMLRKLIRRLPADSTITTDSINSAIVVILYTSAITALWSLSITSCALTTLTVVFLSLVCPVWMKWAQKWKHEIKGPWDPAEPIITSRIYS